MSKKTRLDFSTDSEWYTYMVTHPEEFEDENQKEDEKTKEREYKKAIYYCQKCGYIVDETDPDFEKKENDKIKRDENGNILKCPNCGALAKHLIKISEKEKNKILRKKKIAQEKEEDRKIEKVRADIKDDMLDLLDDLKYRLENNEININRFIVIFINLSKSIISRNAKEINIDWLEYRRAIFGMADTVIDAYEVQTDAENIIENYEEDIESDKLYIAECKYYIEDDKYAIPDYEMQERIKKYDKMQDNLFKKERMKELEEEYQKRRVALEKRADERIKRRIERNIG